jgi:hypothetical protein
MRTKHIINACMHVLGQVREARLEVLRNQEQEMSRAKDSFVRKIFHEIKTPCHIMLGSVHVSEHVYVRSQGYMWKDMGWNPCVPNLMQHAYILYTYIHTCTNSLQICMDSSM